MIGEIKIDGQPLKKLLDYEIGEEPLWGDDAGRSTMDGSYSGTLIGYFTKINLNFMPMDEDDMAYNQSLLKRAFFNVTYQDKKTKTMVTERFYNGDTINAKVDSYKKGRYGEFSLSLVAVNRRND